MTLEIGHELLSRNGYTINSLRFKYKNRCAQTIVYRCYTVGREIKQRNTVKYCECLLFADKT